MTDDRWQPKSIAQLADEAAATIHFSPRYSCRAWLRSCDALSQQAQSYRRLQERSRELGDRTTEWDSAEKEFLCWARCASILLELLPSHPQYRDLHADDKAQIRSQGHASLTQLSRLKPVISDRYEASRASGSRPSQARASPQPAPSRGASPQQLPPPAHAAAEATDQDQLLEAQMRRLQVSQSQGAPAQAYRDYTSPYAEPRTSSSASARAYRQEPHPRLESPPARRDVHNLHQQYPSISYPALDPRTSSSTARYSSSTSALVPAPASSAQRPSAPHSHPPTRDRSPASQPPPSSTATTAPASWQGLRTVNVPPSLVKAFLKRAAKNTKKRIETCGLLLGTLDLGVFTVRVLLIPVQKGTSDTCETLEEEKVFDFQDKRGLLTLGWIHTHPTQSCFMSSLDLHTHRGYQVMLPEAIAIVCAPQSSPDLGIFRLTDPPGLQLIMSCTRTETFHPHPDVKGGVYTGGFGAKDQGYGHVRMREGQGVEVVDLRR